MGHGVPSPRRDPGHGVSQSQSTTLTRPKASPRVGTEHGQARPGPRACPTGGRRRHRWPRLMPQLSVRRPGGLRPVCPWSVGDQPAARCVPPSRRQRDPFIQARAGGVVTLPGGAAPGNRGASLMRCLSVRFSGFFHSTLRTPFNPRARALAGRDTGHRQMANVTGSTIGGSTGYRPGRLLSATLGQPVPTAGCGPSRYRPPNGDSHFLGDPLDGRVSQACRWSR